MTTESYWSEITKSVEFRQSELQGKYVADLMRNYSLWLAAESGDTEVTVSHATPEVLIDAVAASFRQRGDLPYLPPDLAELELERLATEAKTTVHDMLRFWRWWNKAGSRVSAMNQPA